jgi:hypothetical protein
VPTTYSKGDYRAEIVDQGFLESPSKRTPGFSLQFKILKRYGADGELQECPQYERTYTQYLNTETGVNILRGDLQALGVEVSDFNQLDLANPNAIKLVGRQIDVQCKIEDFNGRAQERWLISRGPRKLRLDAVQKLNLQFGHLLCPGGASPPPIPVEPNQSDDAF